MEVAGSSNTPTTQTEENKPELVEDGYRGAAEDYANLAGEFEPDAPEQDLPKAEAPAEPKPVEQPPAVESKPETPVALPVAAETPKPPELKPVEKVAPLEEAVKPVEAPQQITADQYQEWENKAVTRLTETVYKLSEEQAQELDTAPSRVAPQLMARMELRVMKSCMETIIQQLPMMLESIQVSGKERTKAEDAFYSLFPMLKTEDGRFAQDIVAVAKATRASRPDISTDELYKTVGLTVSALHRIPLPEGFGEGRQEVEMIPPPKPLGISGSAGLVPQSHVRTSNVYSDLAEVD